MSKKPRQKHLMKELTKREKKTKPWDSRKVAEETIDIFANVTMSDVFQGFRNKHISVRDSQYKERMG